MNIEKSSSYEKEFSGQDFKQFYYFLTVSVLFPSTGKIYNFLKQTLIENQTRCKVILQYSSYTVKRFLLENFLNNFKK